MKFEKYKCIFLHFHKTAGTSIESVIGGGDALNIGKHRRQKHLNAEDAYKLYYSDWNDYYKFSFMRNPYDLMVSYYNFRMRMINGDFGRKERYMANKYRKSTFKTWICSNMLGDPRLTTQYDFLSVNGNLATDFIGKYENLQEDFNIICDKIGIPKQELPHKNKSKHKHYTEYYDDETKSIVAKKYAKDIEYFGYKFGE
jgi:hypothetical protein